LPKKCKLENRRQFSRTGLLSAKRMAPAPGHGGELLATRGRAGLPPFSSPFLALALLLRLPTHRRSERRRSSGRACRPAVEWRAVCTAVLAQEHCRGRRFLLLSSRQGRQLLPAPSSGGTTDVAEKAIGTHRVGSVVNTFSDEWHYSIPRGKCESRRFGSTN
jgi:hypothetical protein